MSVGMSVPRIDARAKVTGQALYPGDVSLPGMAHAKVLWSRRPHARVLRVDASEALALPGVLAVFTGSDLPRNEYGLMVFDAPVLVSPGAAAAGGFDGVSRHYGEKIAFVVADTEAIAERARDLIRVEYEDLPLLTSIHDALLPGAPELHPHYPGNVVYEYNIARGDAEAAFAEADAIVEDVYTTGAQEHAFLQPEAGVSYIDEHGRVTVVVAGQWTHEDQAQIAHALNLSADQVRVIYPAIGGAFGGREDMSVQIVLALAAWKLRRPVKIVWSREESIIGHHKRHPTWCRARLGATKDGALVACSVELLADAGPYNYTSNKVLGNAALTCIGPYLIPHVHVNARAVATNNTPTGAFRGFGAPQGLFVAETQMNKLAAALGMDPVALRVKNAWRDGAEMATGAQIVPGCSLVETLEACAERTAAAPPGHARVGRGFACGHKNIGFSFGFVDKCEATVELFGKAEIERATVYHAGADCGQGAHTAMRQIAATALGLPFDKIDLVASDTATSGSSGSASASRLTFMLSNSIAGAAKLALDKWRDEERPVRAHYVYIPRQTTMLDHATGEGDPCITFAYVAQSADVDVDERTGHIRVRRIVSADDVGKAVNPRQIVGQIEGGVVQALGWTALENYAQKDGRILTEHFSTYLIPSVFDIPDAVESVILEIPDPQGYLGIRGMAELPFLCVAPAVVAAVHDATGVWINDLPLTPERVRSALRRA